MSNKKVKGCELITKGMVLVAIALMMTLLMGIFGCSAGPKKDPTDPVGSKPAEKELDSDRLIGTGPGGGNIGTTPRARYGTQGSILESLLNSGGGQAGDALNSVLLAGVYDAETLEPVEGAYVSVGADGTIYGLTDDIGCILMRETFLQINPGGGRVSDLYVTAGAEGYKLTSYSKLRHSVVLFLLEPLESSTPETATLSGTIEFNTDEFAGEVYATNETAHMMRELFPPSSGVTQANFELAILADTPGIFVTVWRDPATHQILRVFHEIINPVSAGDTLEILPNYEEYVTDPGTGETDILIHHNWVEWESNASEYTCIVEYVQELYDDISSVNANFRYHSVTAPSMISQNSEYGTVVFNDATKWVPLENHEDQFTTFNSFVVPNYRQLIPFSRMSVWVDVAYDDGSGEFALVDYGTLVNPQQVVALKTPPVLVSPTHGASGVGLTPTLEWTCDSNDIFNQTIITLWSAGDPVIWTINVARGTLETKLPTLPSEMAAWGLQEDEPFLAAIIIENNQQTSTTSDGTVVTFNGENNIVPITYSKFYAFTP